MKISVAPDDLHTDTFTVADELLKQAAEHAAQGQRVRFTLNGETIGFYPPQPFLHLSPPRGERTRPRQRLPVRGNHERGC